MKLLASVKLVIFCAMVNHARSDYSAEFFMMRPANYSPREIPITAKGTPPFAVRVGLEIWTIAEVSLEKQHMEVDLILTVAWMDHRLSTYPNITVAVDWLDIGKEVDYIWTPVLAFQNCKGCSRITFKSNSGIPVFVHKTEELLWAEVRQLLRFTCNINLRFYPMDVQNCLLQIYTSSSNSAFIVLQHYLREGPRLILGNTTLSEFATPIIHTGQCTFIDIDGDNYSCLELVVRFERLIGYHLVTSYLPTMLIVVLSWISFWIPVDCVPARVALGLTSLLTLATRLDQAQRQLPAVSYAKAIDVWMLACIVMVSMSLLEFAISSHLTRRQRIENQGNERGERNASFKNTIDKSINLRNSDICTPVIKVRQLSSGPQKVAPMKNEELKITAKNPHETFADSMSKVVFPVTFAVFNFIYWTYYLNAPAE